MRVSRSHRKHRPRLILIGWDGADFHRVSRWLQSGKLPTLAHIVGEGCLAPLRSTVPPVTLVAWTTLMTGLSPGSHGILGWQDAFRPAGRSGRPPSIWELLSRRGRTVGVFNMPGNYPPPQVNGFAVSGLETPGFGAHMAYPSEAFSTIERSAGRYDPFPANAIPGNFELREIEHQIRCKTDAARSLLDEYRPEVFSLVYNASDWVQHACLARPRYQDEERTVDDVNLHVHELLDNELSRWVADYAGPDTTVMVVSDHGASIAQTAVSLHKLFADAGWLRVRPAAGAGSARVHLYSRAAQAALGLGHAVKQFSPWLFSRLGRLRRATAAHLAAQLQQREIDWEHTVAVPVGSSVHAGVRLCVENREPAGVVPPEQADGVQEQIASTLLEVQAPDGEPLFEDVVPGESEFRGPHAGRAPDLLLVPSRPVLYALPDRDESWANVHLLLEQRQAVASLDEGVGVHAMEGILAARGPHITGELPPLDAGLVDIAPTMLYALGEPIPAYMEGQVLEGIFDCAHRRHNPPQFTEESMCAGASDGERYTPQEAYELRERLSALGYF